MVAGRGMRVRKGNLLRLGSWDSGSGLGKNGFPLWPRPNGVRGEGGSRRTGKRKIRSRSSEAARIEGFSSATHNDRGRNNGFSHEGLVSTLLNSLQAFGGIPRSRTPRHGKRKSAGARHTLGARACAQPAEPANGPDRWAAPVTRSLRPFIFAGGIWQLHEGA